MYSDLTDLAVTRRVRPVARAALADLDRLRQRLDAHVDELSLALARGTAPAAAGSREACSANLKTISAGDMMEKLEPSSLALARARGARVH